MRAIIVDDEPQARESVRVLLRDVDDVEVLTECDNGLDAVNAILELSPDLIFLDIQMPEMNGFEVLNELEEIPHVIFITAYDEYAIKAFEVNAIDYILKPYDDERFFAALEKVRVRNSSNRALGLDQISQLIESYRDQVKDYLSHLTVRSGNKIVFIEDKKIEWIEAADQYCKIHTKEGHFMVRESMKHYEKRLNPNLFFRAHRSSIVNLREVRELQPFKKGRYVAVLKSGDLVELGPAKFEELKKKMSSTNLNN